MGLGGVDIRVGVRARDRARVRVGVRVRPARVAPVSRLADVDASEQRLAARRELGAEGGHAVEVRAGLVLGRALVSVRVRVRARVRVRVRVRARPTAGWGMGKALR